MDRDQVRYEPEEPQHDLQAELANLLNRFSRENASNTPDFILASFMMAALRAFESCTNWREGWKSGDKPQSPGPEREGAAYITGPYVEGPEPPTSSV